MILLCARYAHPGTILRTCTLARTVQADQHTLAAGIVSSLGIVRWKTPAALQGVQDALLFSFFFPCARQLPPPPPPGPTAWWTTLRILMARPSAKELPAARPSPKMAAAASPAAAAPGFRTKGVPFERGLAVSRELSLCVTEPITWTRDLVQGATEGYPHVICIAHCLWGCTSFRNRGHPHVAAQLRRLLLLQLLRLQRRSRRAAGDRHRHFPEQVDASFVHGVIHGRPVQPP